MLTCQINIHHNSVYLDKLAHIQVVINCRYSIAQMCTREDTQARLYHIAEWSSIQKPSIQKTFEYRSKLAWYSDHHLNTELVFEFRYRTSK